MAHSPEPWTQKLTCIIDANRRVVVETYSVSDADSERIMACVNACRGISDQLLQQVIDGKLEIQFAPPFNGISQ